MENFIDNFGTECERCGHTIWESQELCSFCESNWGTDYYEDYIRRHQLYKKKEEKHKEKNRGV